MSTITHVPMPLQMTGRRALPRMCSCGQLWDACERERSAEARWAKLREWLDEQVAYLNAEMPAETVLMQRNLRRQARILTGVREHMDEMEGRR